MKVPEQVGDSATFTRRLLKITLLNSLPSDLSPTKQILLPSVSSLSKEDIIKVAEGAMQTLQSLKEPTSTEAYYLGKCLQVVMRGKD
jgi:hypothetical protein